MVTCGICLLLSELLGSSVGRPDTGSLTGLDATYPVTQLAQARLHLADSILAQLFVALALGASLHAVGQRASIATLLVVITLASIIGGAVPVPGGMGVVEAGLIGGLTAVGVPQDQAVAAVFIQRLFTAYLPPIWGWITLAWMRRREYV